MVYKKYKNAKNIQFAIIKEEKTHIFEGEITEIKTF